MSCPATAALTSSSSHGAGSYVFDVAGKRYLDLGSGIAVNCLGHAHPAITEALVEQSQKLIHVSNLYFTEPQGRLAAELVKRLGPGKCFFQQQRRGGERGTCTSSRGNSATTRAGLKF
jgi:acetylornithine/N-succinyldiaminopimelate aminotransferase